MKKFSESQTIELNQLYNERKSRSTQTQLIINELSNYIENEIAKIYCNEGIGRRLNIIKVAISNIFEIFPPDREKFLSNDECTNIAIQYHAFSINLFGMLDNIAWIFTHINGLKLDKRDVYLKNKKILQVMPEEFKSYITNREINNWVDSYAKIYRDSATHRIPPYHPSRVYSPSEAEKYKELERRTHDALISACNSVLFDPYKYDDLFSIYQELNNQKESIGRNSLHLATSIITDEKSPIIYFHPQLLADWGLALDILNTFDRSMRTKYSFRPATIPNIF